MKYYLLVASIVIFDQISKILIKQYWNANEISSTINIIGDFLKFYFIENPGIAFGLDPFNPMWLTIITCSIIIFLFVHFVQLIKTNSSDSLAIAFVLGGAFGNAIDRMLALFPSKTNYNGVIDFIDIGFGNFRWYIFNVADMSITIGLILIIYQGFFVKKIEKQDNI